jgi:hypothetical protein
MVKASQARGFGIVASRVAGNEVVDGVVGVARPRQEVINGAPPVEAPGAVEAVLALGVGQRRADFRSLGQHGKRNLKAPNKLSNLLRQDLPTTPPYN